jgi:uncharacterized protein
MAGPSSRNPLWNTEQRRLRALWRVLAIVVVLVAAQVLVWAYLEELPFLVGAAGDIVVAQLLLPLLVVRAGARLLDRRPLRGYGLRLDRRWGREFALGAALGVLMYGAVFAVLIASGWGRVADVLSPGPQAGFALLFAVVVLNWLANGFWEELVFRGVMVKNAAEGFGGRLSRNAAIVAALVLSTVVFTLVHVPTYLDAPVPLSALLLSWLLLGGLLGLAYVLTGRLGLAMGLHFTVNLAINNLFGLHGEFGATATLVLTETVGPAALAGMGGAVHIAGILLGYVVLLLWARRRPQGLALAAQLTRPPEGVAGTPASVPRDADDRARQSEGVAR